MKKEIEKLADKLVNAYKKNKLISPLPIKYTKNIKNAIIDEIAYSINCIHSRGPSSLLSQSNQLTPIKNFPYGRMYIKQ